MKRFLRRAGLAAQTLRGSAHPAMPPDGTRRRFTAGVATGVAALAWPGACAAAAAARPTGEPLVLGVIGLSFYQVVGAVIESVLQRLQVPYRSVEGQHGDLYPRLARGELDLLAAAWLPHAHGPLHAASAGSTTELARLYDDAMLYWAVPAHVPEALVRSIEDLRKPEVLARMERRIVGIGPDSGLMRGAVQIHRDYALGAAGYEIVTGPPAPWVQSAREAVDQGLWRVIPLWRPQWMNREFRLRVLEEPRGVYRADHCSLVAANTLRERLPPSAWATLARVALDLDAVTTMDHAMVVGRQTAQQAAQAWMQSNRARVDGWFA